MSVMRRVFILLVTIGCGLVLFSQSNEWKGKYRDVYELHNGHHVVRNSKGLFGLVDQKGVEVIEPSFNAMLYEGPNDGILGVSLDGKKWGYVHISGRVVVPFLYEKVYPFSEGYGVIYDKKRCAMVDVEGKIIVPFIFDIIYPIKNGFAEVVNWCYFDPKSKGDVEFIGGRHGVIDTNGRVVVPLDYDDIGHFCDGIAVVEKNNLFGLIDTNGKMLLRPICKEIKEFNTDGLAECSLYDRWIYIDKSGKLGDEVPGKNKPKRAKIPVDKEKVEALLNSNMVFVKVENSGNNKCPVLPSNGDYFISKYEVTFGLFEQFLDDSGYITTLERKEDKNSVERMLLTSINKNCPVYNVSWKDCLEFCFWLSGITGKMFYMPDEAEWEYAARGGNKSSGYKYSGSNDINEVAWYLSNSGNKVHEVGIKKANELGIYDMSGNAWEWCRNFYDKGVNMEKSLTEDMIAEQRAIRGGAIINDKKYIECDNRQGQKPREPGMIGFRVIYYVD